MSSQTGNNGKEIAANETGPVEPEPTNTTRIAQFKDNQILLMSSMLPSIAEMEWMKTHAPHHFETMLNDRSEESKHRRRMEIMGQNTNRYLGTIIIATICFTVWQGNPWAAVTLMTVAAVIYASAHLILSNRHRNMLSNVTLLGRSSEENHLEER